MKLAQGILRRMSTSALSTIADQLKLVTDSIQAAASTRPSHLQYAFPRLVAVSKTKSIDMIIEAYDAGQRHFGENYVAELHDKANDIELQDRCEDIKWHFIGHVQKNKIPKLLDVPNLYVVETVDTEKLAKTLNDKYRSEQSNPLKVMLQVNTSGEENKNGCPPGMAVQLASFIRDQCPQLHLIGLMTIGSFDHDPNSGSNPDFESLVQVREEICNSFNIPTSDLELSMGMSADYELAIAMGSTNVRIGSTIFGARNRPQNSSGTNSDVTSSAKNNVTSATDQATATALNVEQIEKLALT